LPYSIAVCYLALHSVPAQLEEIGTLQGYNPVERFLWITFPLARKGFVMAFLLGFVFAFGELNMSLLVIPPGITTIAIRTFTLLHYGVRSDVASCSLFTILLFALAAIVGYWVRRPGQMSCNF
jgi:iron(III) transport system permease protein